MLVLGLQWATLQHLQGRTHIVIHVIDEGRNGMQRMNLRCRLLPRDVGQLVF